MWSLRVRQDGSMFLTYDKYRRFTFNLRGLWEYVGQQDSLATAKAIAANQKAGYLCCNDDEGGVRALVLTEEDQHA